MYETEAIVKYKTPRKTFQASTGVEATTSVLPVQNSIHCAMKLTLDP